MLFKTYLLFSALIGIFSIAKSWPVYPHCVGNEVYTDNIFCEPTCENYQDSVEICIRIGPIEGCKCKPPFVRNTSTEKCVLPQDCKKRPKNIKEYYENKNFEYTLYDGKPVWGRG